MNDISYRLKIIMEGMSVRKFAEQLGLSPTTVQEYLKGRTPPSDFIVRVCERFKVDSWWLLTGERNNVEVQPSTIVSDGYEYFLDDRVEKRFTELQAKLLRIVCEKSEKEINTIESLINLLDPGERPSILAKDYDQGLKTTGEMVANPPRQWAVKSAGKLSDLVDPGEVSQVKTISPAERLIKRMQDRYDISRDEAIKRLYDAQQESNKKQNSKPVFNRPERKGTIQPLGGGLKKSKDSEVKTDEKKAG